VTPPCRTAARRENGDKVLREVANGLKALQQNPQIELQFVLPFEW
jgi:hypothetical protein